MLNLLRSDFYRLFRSKSFYICAAVECFLFCLSIFILDMANHMIENSGQANGSMLPSGGLNYGLTVFSGNISMIISIVIAIFIVAEFTYGTMKNVVSKGFSKVQIYLSKLITMLAAVFMMVFASMLTGTICGTIVIGKLGEFKVDMLKVIGIELLLFTALTAIFVFFSMLVKNLGGVIAINIIGVLSFAPLIFKLLELLFKNKIVFSKYSLINNITLFSGNTVDGSDYLRAAIVALVYIAITIALGIFAFIKSDIK